MRRQFLANLSFLVLLNLIIKPVYIFGIEVSVQNAVGAEVYGLFFTLLNSAYLFQIVNDFGIQIYHNRQVASDRSELQRLFGGLLQLKLILAGIFVLLVLAFTFIAGYGAWWHLTLPIVVNLALVSLILYLRSGISGLGHYRTDSLLSVMDKLFMILVCGALLLTLPDFEITHFIYAQMGSLLVTALIAFIILRSRHAVRITRIGRQQIVALVRAAGPYALAVFLMSIYTRVDGVMIEQLAPDGQYQAGLYAAGYRLLDAANMFAFLFAVLLLPMFSRLMNDRVALLRLLGQGFRLMWCVTVGVGVVCYFFRIPVMELLYAEADREWGAVFGLLILSFIGVGLMYVFGTLVTATGNLRRLNQFYLCFALFNIACNFILIPRFGAWGAAMATLTTQSLVAVVLVAYVSTSFQWSFHRQVLRLLLFAGGVTGMAFLTRMLVSHVPWIACMVLALLFALAWALITRLVSIDEVRGLLRPGQTPH
ncbi:MAG: oligosaccharide flippase family protein [Saprospiraceae bacterium]|nr:oligosaccharide flippase family protein [Saprospiraceae bacterium]